MSTLHEFQRGMRSALLNDEVAFLKNDFAEVHVPISAGTAVYRNNVFAALTKALGDLYPVVKQLVGDGFFAYAANDYITAHPPSSPVLADFGDGFPAFLDGFDAAQSVPYLSAMARLELARHLALHAADADPLNPKALKGVQPECLGDLRFRLHPSAHLLRSSFPVNAIWDAHQDGGEPDGSLEFTGRETCLLVARPKMAVKILAISVENFEFITRLAAGDTLTQAFAVARDDLAPEQILSELLVFGAFADFDLSEEKGS